MADLMRCTEAEELIALAVLGVLDITSITGLERHLSTCDACRETARAYRRAVAMLPEAVEPAAPPRELRRRLMTAVYSSVVDGRQRRPSLLTLWRLIPARRGFTVAAVATTVAALVVGIWGATHTSNASETFAVAATTNQPGVHGQLTYFPSSSRSVLTVTGVPATGGVATAAGVYEVWLVPRSGAPVAAAFLAPVPQSDAWTAVISGNVLAYRMMAATLEPPGGTAAPTGPEIFSVALSPS